MIIRNRTSRFMSKAIDPSKTETSFLLLISRIQMRAISHKYFLIEAVLHRIYG